MAGYVLSRLAKKESCTHCYDFVQSKKPLSNMDANITKLFALKEYRVGCSVYCTKMTFELITFVEKIIRKCQSQFLSAAINVGETLSTQIKDATPYIIFPDCHNIKQTIISRYVTIPLHFFGKKRK